jgi:putative DNA primase/helicase
VAANYADVIEQLRAGGLSVDALRVCGRVVRCAVEGDREKRGWYVLHEVRAPDGQDRIVGSWGIWRGTDNGATPIRIERSELTDEQLAAIKTKLREDRRRAESNRKREAEKAARVAEASWRKALHTPPDDAVPDYLRRKGVGAHGIRYLPSGAIVIPMHDASGRVHGLQAILSRETHKARIAKTGRDKEYWPPGLAKQSHWFQIGVPTAVCLLAEGYATGATLHEATGLPVAVAFDAGNLAPVARALRKRYPQARLLICADDDFATRDNPGITAASAAAMEVSGAWVAPLFDVPEQIELRYRITTEIDWSAPDYRAQVGAILTGRRKLTDFNDLHAAEGLLTVRAQIEARLQDLGWRTEGHSRLGTGTGGEGKRAADDWIFSLDRLLHGYALIYATDTVFDTERGLVLGLGPLRSAAGKGLVRQWLEHPDRRTVLQEQVGFDPTGVDSSVKCNLWGGWPTTPKAGSCARLLELLDYLCNWEPSQQRELADWLIRWIAYPIQHPGAKMQTAVLIHGPEGTGKNLLFNAVCQIYGRYACNFGQSELESAFNGWMSAKLFAVGNEVVTRAEMYHTQGRLKDMVTGEDHHINEKMLPVRIERNRTNIVLNSNRPDIAKLDQGDRRYCVIWTPPALSADFYRQVADELANGGAEALHHHLLHLDLGDFDRHTKPPLTRAKEDLVELGMDSTERFLRDWLAGNVADLPAVCCRSDDLYTAYRVWCQKEGIVKPAQKQTLLTVTGKKPGVVKSQERYLINLVAEKKTVVIAPGHGGGPDDGSSRAAWIGKHVADFGGALMAWRNQGAGSRDND